jgi:osmotically-inducible protein OsmY
MRSATHINHRPDAEIFTEARHALDVRPGVPASVRIHLDEGVMTLTGSVRTASERSEAENTVRSIPGVRRLVNEIVVARIPSAEGFEPPDDQH